MERNKRIVIIGATSAIAEQCARIWVREGAVEMTLVGRHRQAIERIVADLVVRSPSSTFHSEVADFLNPIAIRALVEKICDSGPVDIVLIAHGSLPDQIECQQNLEKCQDALLVNGLSPVMFAEAFAAQMEARGQGTIALIGSVAGDRGRQSNYVYGAAKGLVSRYAEGMLHRFANTGIKVILIKPGPTDTPMTAHLRGSGVKMASAEQVAVEIVKGIAKGKSVVYTPAKWQLIMLIIRHLPFFIFKKLRI